MQLPYTIVFEPPSQKELRALLRMRGHWVAGLIVALTIGIAYLLSNVARADALDGASGAPLTLSSRPAGASVWLDGHERGTTPLSVLVQPGAHSVQLNAPDALESKYTLQVGAEGARLDAALWRRQPKLTRLRAALPGAKLADVRLLENGQVGLTISLPPGRQLQAWRLDPRSGSLVAVLTSVSGPRLAFAPDGQHVAYIGAEIGPPAPPARGWEAEPGVSVVWISAGDGIGAAPDVAWRAPLEPAEQLVDVSWSPRNDRLVVVSSESLAAGATRSRVWLMDADLRSANVLVSLPSEIVPGSEVWSPDGRAVAFVAHAGELNALCVLQAEGIFRYIADLDPAPTSLLAYAPLAWSLDGTQVVFVAPHQRPPGAPLGWLQADARHAVYTATVDELSPLAIADTEAVIVTWREDGQLLGLARAAPAAPLSVRRMNGSNPAGEQLLELPLAPPNAYTALWDVQQARLLVATLNAAGGLDYWLARLDLEADA